MEELADILQNIQQDFPFSRFKEIRSGFSWSFILIGQALIGQLILTLWLVVPENPNLKTRMSHSEPEINPRLVLINQAFLHQDFTTDYSCNNKIKIILFSADQWLDDESFDDLGDSR